jgi:hypothetical protein
LCASVGHGLPGDFGNFSDCFTGSLGSARCGTGCFLARISQRSADYRRSFSCLLYRLGGH